MKGKIKGLLSTKVIHGLRKSEHRQHKQRPKMVKQNIGGDKREYSNSLAVDY